MPKECLKLAVLNLWVATLRESPDNLLGVGWDHQKFSNLSYKLQIAFF